MSAFIVSEACMRNCLRGIWQSRARLRWHAPEIAKLADDPVALASALYALNQSAVEQRYPGPEEAEFCELPPYSAAIGPSDCGPIQAYKSLLCLHYQCSEGEAEKSVIYRELARIVEDCAAQIVSETPEYQAAAWG